MKRFDISVILDGIFAGFAVFFTLFIIFSTFAGATTVWICSLLIGAAAAVAGTFLIAKRRGKKALKSADIPKKENLMFYLALHGTDKTFIKLFGEFGKTVIKTPRGLYLESADCYLYPCFSFDGLTKSRIGEIYKKANGKTAYILAPAFSDDLRSFTRIFGDKIRLFGGEEVYELFKKADMLPPELNSVKKHSKKEAFKAAARTVFTRRRSPRYFVFGITFLLFSFLVPFKLYYIVFGSIMMILALLCLFVSPAAPEKNFWEV